MNVKFLALLFSTLVLAGCLEQGVSNLGNVEIGFVERVETGFVERAVDGDTLLLESGERVRLIGIDAPERKEACYKEAGKRLHELVGGKQVILVKDSSERDRYGRLVRYVYLDNTFVNLAMVEEGLAKSFEFEPDTSLKSFFQDAELTAQSGSGCIWSTLRPE